MNQGNNNPTPEAVAMKASPTSFLRLAPEIRNTVYESILLPIDSRMDIRDVVEPPILRTCHQIREEGLKMFWSQPLKLIILPPIFPDENVDNEGSLKCLRHLACTGRLSFVRNLCFEFHHLISPMMGFRLPLPFLQPFVEIIRNNETVRINYRYIMPPWNDRYMISYQKIISRMLSLVQEPHVKSLAKWEFEEIFNSFVRCRGNMKHLEARYPQLRANVAPPRRSERLAAKKPVEYER